MLVLPLGSPHTHIHRCVVLYDSTQEDDVGGRRGGTGPGRCRENVGRVTIDTNGVGRLKEQVLTAAATYIYAMPVTLRSIS